MKYIQIIMLATLLVFLGACEETDNDPELIPAIALSVNSDAVSIGSLVAVSAEISDIPESIFAVSLRLSYDSTRLSLDDSQSDWIGNSWATSAIGLLEEDSGIVYLSISQIAGSENVDGGTIFTIDFTAEASGTAVLDFLTDYLVFYDEDGSEIVFTDLEVEGVSVTID